MVSPPASRAAGGFAGCPNHAADFAAEDKTRPTSLASPSSAAERMTSLKPLSARCWEAARSD